MKALAHALAHAVGGEIDREDGDGDGGAEQVQAADVRRARIELEGPDDERDARDLRQTQDQRHAQRDEHALPQALRHAVRALRAHVLPGEGGHGVLDADDGDHEDVFHPAGDGVGGDHALTVVVDQPLQEQKAARDDRLLDRHRRADLQDAPRCFQVHPQFPQ